MTLQGCPRSLILVPIENTCRTSYWFFMSNLGPILPRFGDIVYSKSHFFPIPTPIPVKILGCSLWSRSLMLGSAERRMPRLISHENIFWSITTYVTTIPQRHGRTTCRGIAVKCVASRSKKSAIFLHSLYYVDSFTLSKCLIYTSLYIHAFLTCKVIIMLVASCFVISVLDSHSLQFGFTLTFSLKSVIE